MSVTKTITIPKDYISLLNVTETQIAIKEIKHYFEDNFSKELNLMKVSAPLILKEGTGINDNLNGTERTVSFDALDIGESKIEVVQSLAKWKRVALKELDLSIGEGIYTNMNALRRDETLDNLHSIYVDQWDWEKIITREQRNLTTLKNEVVKIYDMLKSTERYLHELHPILEPVLPDDIYFISTEALESLYPHSTPKQREDEITKKYGAVFIMQIGGELPSGKVHDGRSPDYDDWQLNGDIIIWYPLLEQSIELSSMGIRVDELALQKQLKVANNEDRCTLDYHKSVLNGTLPYTIGGGIGQSRFCLFLLKKAHIGEVQASVWNDQILKECKENNITLL